MLDLHDRVIFLAAVVAFFGFLALRGLKSISDTITWWLLPTEKLIKSKTTSLPSSAAFPNPKVIDLSLRMDCKNMLDSCQKRIRVKAEMTGLDQVMTIESVIPWTLGRNFSGLGILGSVIFTFGLLSNWMSSAVGDMDRGGEFRRIASRTSLSHQHAITDVFSRALSLYQARNIATYNQALCQFDPEILSVSGTRSEAHRLRKLHCWKAFISATSFESQHCIGKQRAISIACHVADGESTGVHKNVAARRAIYRAGASPDSVVCSTTETIATDVRFASGFNRRHSKRRCDSRSVWYSVFDCRANRGCSTTSLVRYQRHCDCLSRRNSQGQTESDGKVCTSMDVGRTGAPKGRSQRSSISRMPRNDKTKFAL